MNFNFQNQNLKDLYCEGVNSMHYSGSVIKAFNRKMSIIDGAENENDLRAMKGNNFKKRKGEANNYTIRMNIQYRLEFSIDKKSGTIIIKNILKH